MTSTNLLWRMFIVPMARRAHCKGANKDIGRLVGGPNDCMRKTSVRWVATKTGMSVLWNILRFRNSLEFMGFSEYN